MKVFPILVLMIFLASCSSSYHSSVTVGEYLTQYHSDRADGRAPSSIISPVATVLKSVGKYDDAVKIVLKDPTRYNLARGVKNIKFEELDEVAQKRFLRDAMDGRFKWSTLALKNECLNSSDDSIKVMAQLRVPSAKTSQTAALMTQTHSAKSGQMLANFSASSSSMELKMAREYAGEYRKYYRQYQSVAGLKGDLDEALEIALTQIKINKGAETPVIGVKFCDNLSETYRRRLLAVSDNATAYLQQGESMADAYKHGGLGIIIDKNSPLDEGLEYMENSRRGLCSAPCQGTLGRSVCR